MKLSLKTLTIPFGTRDIDAVVTWAVRWTSRHGEYHSDTRPECEVFKSKAEAVAYAEALQAAFRLLRHTSRTHVEIEKQSWVKEAIYGRVGTDRNSAER